jgi:Pretoxin HINT domain
MQDRQREVMGPGRTGPAEQPAPGAGGVAALQVLAATIGNRAFARAIRRDPRAASIQRYPAEAIAAQLGRRIGAEDTAAQRDRIDRLRTLFSGLEPVDAKALRDVLLRPEHPLAKRFHYVLSRPSRTALIGILEDRAASLETVVKKQPLDPSERAPDEPLEEAIARQPWYFDNLVDYVAIWMLRNNMFEVFWSDAAGVKGSFMVHMRDWDRQGGTSATPVFASRDERKLGVFKTREEALKQIRPFESAFEQAGAAQKFYAYHSVPPEGVVIPTWFSAQTAPRTYALMNGVFATLIKQAKGWEEIFGGLRDGMIIGGAIGVTFRLGRFVLPRFFGGKTKTPAGGRPVDVPPVETAPRTGPKAEPAKTAEPAKPPAAEPGKPPTVEPAKPAPQPDVTKQKPPSQGAAKVPYRPCFVAGTLVEGAEGAVEIERLGVGAQVLARVDSADPARPERVAAAHGGTTAVVLHVHADGARVTCTRDHRFLVRGKGWVPARKLTHGDLLERIDGGTLPVAKVVSEHASEAVATYNLTVEDASTYFVRIGGHAVLVHNGDDLPDLERVLYWFFGNKPRARPDIDLKGMSVWRTESRADVNTLFDTRVNQSNRPVSDPHGFFTPEQLKQANFVAPETPGDPANPLTGKLPHHDVRPASNPDPSVKLSANDVKALDEAAKKVHSPKNAMQPKVLQGKC